MTRHRLSRCSSLAGFLLALLAWVPAALAVEAERFASPDQAAAALVAALRGGDTARVQKVLGLASPRLISSGDPVADRQARERFLTAFDQAHTIVAQGDDRAILTVGEDDWPFPIPAVRTGAGWRFDAKAGEQEIINRRIGDNELSAIEVCLAYVDAQHDYATKDRNDDGFLEYAQRFVSRPGMHDGLYWPATDGEEESPIGPLMARARAEGYAKTEGKPTPYHGYYYRILTAQGPHAPGGALNYMVRGHLIGGFALVAYPAQYGASGIMTFIVNHDGEVFQKDLGPDTAKIAKAMTRYDPDPSWTKP